VRPLSIQEWLALDHLPPVHILGIVRFVQRQLFVLSLRVLRVDEEDARAQIDILARILLITVIQPVGRQPGAAPEAKAGAGLRKLAGQETAKLGADELGVHIAGQEERGREAVPVLAEAHGVASSTNLGEGLINVQRCVVARIDTPDAGETEIDSEQDASDHDGKLRFGRDTPNESLRISIPDDGEECVKSHGSVECEEWIGRVHETLLFMRLQREDSKPHIEGREDDESAQTGLGSLRCAAAEKEFLKQEEGQRQEGQNEPQIEV